ncbi:MAG TPA: sigma-54 dependent transcriptional regulator [Dissulfurispiraceae bacterium]|nr:sigma-54 dependent transcriptional regulator [Dissulfurispiraceae bacterium]
MSGAGKVLIVDDEPNALKVLSAILSEEGYWVFEAPDGEVAVKTIETEDVDAVITDLKMPGKDGMYVFERVTESHPDLPVIFLTAYGTVESAVHAITRGAFYYFIKPPDYLKLKSIVSRAVEQRRLKREIRELRRKLSAERPVEGLIGKAPAVLKICDTVEAVKDSASSVIIYGETGTGKEVVARALHFTSARSAYPFVAVNCAALPGGLIESELFGFEKGAFTGAVSRKIGKFEEASGGTLFLDEIAELDMGLQAKLLRVVQESEVVRLGGNKSIKVDVRLISSTNRDLKTEVGEGRFREDLFYRLNVIEIEVPPLRERREDIPLLVSEFLKEYCRRENKVISVSDDVLSIFSRYEWPGNVRELKNVVERAVVLAKGRVITSRDLPQKLLPAPVEGDPVPPQQTLRHLEEQAVREALKTCEGNKSRAAGLLGISRKAFYKRLRDMRIE